MSHRNARPRLVDGSVPSCSTDARSAATRARQAGRGPCSSFHVPLRRRSAMAAPARSAAAKSGTSQSAPMGRSTASDQHHARRAPASRRSMPRRPGCRWRATTPPRGWRAGAGSRKTLVGSLATRPSGVTLPSASPARNAANACFEVSRPSRRHAGRQASARMTKRSPASAQDGHQAPADAPDAVEHLGVSRLPDGAGKEREATQRRRRGDDVPTTAGGHGERMANSGVGTLRSA